MNVSIVDDEKEWVETIRAELTGLLGDETKFFVFDSGEAFLEKMQPFDIVIFDVELKGSEKDGLEYCKIYKSRYPDIENIAMIVTTHTEFGRRGYVSSAFRYLNKEKLHEELDEAVASIRLIYQSFETVEIKPVKMEPIRMMIKNIYGVETVGRSLKLMTGQGEIPISGSFGNLEKLLENYGFYLIHKGVLINMKYVESIEKDFLTLQGVRGKRFEISRRRYPDFIGTFMNWRRDRAYR